MMCKYNELDFLLNQSLQICAANERNKLNKNKKNKVYYYYQTARVLTCAVWA